MKKIHESTQALIGMVMMAIVIAMLAGVAVNLVFMLFW